MGDEERMFTKHAIKIVIETKQKRKMMYAKKEDDALRSGQESVLDLESKLTTSHKLKGKQLVENSRDFTASGIDQSTFVESSVRTSVNKYNIKSGKPPSRLQSGKPKAFLTDINDSRSNAPSFTKNMSSINLKSYGSSDFVASRNVENKNEVISKV